jgi:segregation and condensation protein B
MGKRGFIIIEVEDSFQLCSNPEYFEYIKTLFSSSQKKKLTQPLLETLAIIAYKQPVTKSDIEEIRGVSAEHSVNKLIEYNLVCEKGRRESPGKPILFGTTEEFLKYYGYSNLSQLPVIEPEAISALDI